MWCEVSFRSRGMVRHTSASIWFARNAMRERLARLELSGEGSSIEARELQKKIESCAQVGVTGH